MIIGHRTHTFRLGTVEGWPRHCEAEGFAIQKRQLGSFIGLYPAEVGRLHRIVPIWAFESLAAQEGRRAAMSVDSAWRAFNRFVWSLDAIQEQ